MSAIFLGRINGLSFVGIIIVGYSKPNTGTARVTDCAMENPYDERLVFLFSFSIFLINLWQCVHIKAFFVD